MNFTCYSISNGIWSGLLQAETRPERLSVLLRGHVVAEADLTPDGAGRWRVQISLPGGVISKGVQTLVLVADAGKAGDPVLDGGVVLARMPLLAGQPLAQDLEAEIKTLRDELDMLKREFRFVARRA